MKKSPLVIIFVTVFIDLLGFGIVIPVLPFYAEKYGATGLTVGLLMSSYSFMQLIFSPIWGRISDLKGRRPIILMSLVGSSISYLIFGLADSLAVLFISRFFAGIFAANISTSQAYISDSTTAANRAKGMGLIGAAFGLGFVLGPLFGGYFSHFGYRIPAFLASAICGINFFFALFSLPETLKPEMIGEKRSLSLESIKKTFSFPLLGILVFLMFIITFSFSTLEATFALFAEQKYHFSSVETGYVFGFIGILMAIMQGGLIGHLVKKFGEKRLVVAGTFMMILGLILIPFAPNLYYLLVVLVVLSFGLGINNPSITSLISQHTDPHFVGATMGVSQAMGSLARILGPMSGGFVYDRYGIDTPYIFAGLTMGLAFIMAIVFLIKSQRSKAVVQPK
ncbi:MAG: MFS transporter [Nitrospirae bacterium]|nr:MFS transporter [Nitrospirota bacterium]MBI3352304.1 MFS transporter [Nitrospirota bacterium]